MSIPWGQPNRYLSRTSDVHLSTISRFFLNPPPTLHAWVRTENNNSVSLLKRGMPITAIARSRPLRRKKRHGRPLGLVYEISAGGGLSAIRA
jgi:hypothetical protein